MTLISDKHDMETSHYTCSNRLAPVVYSLPWGSDAANLDDAGQSTLHDPISKILLAYCKLLMSF